MKSTQDIITSSGYPLQIRLQHEIANTGNQHKFIVEAAEHRWVNHETNEEGFVDLIAISSKINLRFVLECKKVTNGVWNFLIPNKQKQKTTDIRCLHATQNILSWTKTYIEPSSHQSAFCIPENNGEKDNRPLEKYASELLLSTEYLANECIRIKDPKTQNKEGIVFIPLIVTTALLQTCLFDSENISLETGILEQNSQTLQEVPYIRFHKNLATSLKYSSDAVNDLKSANKENERTVFVVQAKNLVDFLIEVNRNHF